MKADYDSEADSIQIELVKFDHWDREVMIDAGDSCGVALVNDKPVAVSLRYPREELRLLEVAAERFDLDAMGLRATTQAALAAPDHVVTVEVDPQVLAGSEAPSRAA